MVKADPATPQYALPRRLVADLAAAALLGRRRSFATHARWMLRDGLRPALRVAGAEHIPAHGPGAITVNHYYRPDFFAPWIPAAISAQVGEEIYWTMTNALTYPGKHFAGARRWLSHLALVRVARTYGFNGMPPMPPSPTEVAERAAAVQRLVAHVRAHPQALVGLAPEGGDQPGGVLSLPPDGFGRLALSLARRKMPFYPAGVYEEDGCLWVRFGAPYCLEQSETGDRFAADLAARKAVMTHIAECLPARLRGEFGGPV